jgi:cellulose synthase/poly-beta-1,6-N-acetylglucosamine synthase-like glycosyltransferase
MPSRYDIGTAANTTPEPGTEIDLRHVTDDAPTATLVDLRDPRQPAGSGPSADAPTGVGVREASRLAALVALGLLGTFLLAKVAFRQPDSSLTFYLYGVAVTTVVFVQLLVGTILYRDPAAHPAHDDPDGGSGPIPAYRPRVSCLVAVHNEEKIIRECVASLCGQDYPDLEVIIIDDASTDTTAHILRELESEYPIRVLYLDTNVGKKRALGAGLARSDGEVIAFSDSDSTWAPDAITQAVRAMGRDPDIGGVSGHCRAMNADETLLTRIQDTWYEGQFSVRKAFESHFGAVTCVSGPLAVFRRAAIYNYIPAWESDSFLGDEFRFATDRTLTGYVLMDAERARRLRTLAEGTPFLAREYPWRPWRVVYAKSARSWTTVPTSLRAVLKQQIRWKKSFIRNIFFTGAFYWRRPLLPAAGYYLHILFVFAGPFVAFRHLIYLPAHGDLESMLLYLFGILLVGLVFGLAFRREEAVRTDGPPRQLERWGYRPLMSLLSTLLLSWLIVYSIVTIKRMTWTRS